MNHEQLNTYIKVMEHGSFNKASEALFVTPSAIMRQINRLEHELNVKLFERTNKGITPTIAGNYYYEEVVRWNQEYDRIVRRTKEIHEDSARVNTIRVGVYGNLSDVFIEKYFGKIQNVFPDTKFDFYSYGISSDKVMALINDVGTNIDIVIENYEKWAIEEYHLETLHLYDVPMSCAVSINSDLYAKDVIRIEDLYGKTVGMWNNRRSSIFYDMRKILEEHSEISIKDIPNFDGKIFDNKDNEIILGNLTWSGAHPFYRFIPLDSGYTTPYGIWYRKNPSLKVKIFIEKVKSIAF